MLCPLDDYRLLLHLHELHHLRELLDPGCHGRELVLVLRLLLVDDVHGLPLGVPRHLRKPVVESIVDDHFHIPPILGEVLRRIVALLKYFMIRADGAEARQEPVGVDSAFVADAQWHAIQEPD